MGRRKEYNYYSSAVIGDVFRILLSQDAEPSHPPSINDKAAPKVQAGPDLYPKSTDSTQEPRSPEQSVLDPYKDNLHHHPRIAACMHSY